jgi:VWFA-related protein
LGTLSACLVLALFFKRVQPLQLPSSQVPSAQSAEPHPNQTPQLIPRTHDEREARYLTQHRIILNVHVSDASGKPVKELKETDVTLIDANQPRKLVSFRSVDVADEKNQTHVILVFDTVNSSSRQLRYLVKGMEKYLKQADGPLAYPVSIGLFSGAGVEMGQPSRDRNALLDELKTRAGDLHGTGCVASDTGGETLPFPSVAGAGGIRASTSALACKNERFISSVSALNRLAQEQVKIPGRVILIWMGPGWPLLTDRGFTADTPDVKQNFFYQLVKVSTALREAQITLDSISLPGAASSEESPHAIDIDFFDGVSKPDQARAGNLGLHALVHQSGGQTLENKNDIAGDIAACIADAESYYVLTFDSPPAAEFGEYHSLTVKVDHPDLTVRTNTLYYAEQ